MNMRVKLKVQWHWYSVDDVVGVDNIAVIVEAMQGTNLCQKS